MSYSELNGNFDQKIREEKWRLQTLHVTKLFLAGELMWYVCWFFIEVENEDLKKVVELAEKCQYSKNMVDGHAKSWTL